MSAGIATYLANGWLGSLINSPLVVPTVWFQLHKGDPGIEGLANRSAVLARQSGYFGAPVDGVISLTGEPPAWEMTSGETLTYLSAWDAASGGHLLMNALLTKQVTVADGDVFRLGGGFTVSIKGLVTA